MMEVAAACTSDGKSEQTGIPSIELSPLVFSPEILALYLKWFNNEEVRKYLQPATPRTEEEIKCWLERIESNPDRIYYLIKVGNKYIGHVGLSDVNPEESSAELSMVIGEGDWRHIGMSGLIGDILLNDDRVSTLGISTLKVYFRPDNIASRKAACKAGFHEVENLDSEEYILMILNLEDMPQ